MVCPKCKSDHVNIQVVTTVEEKSKKGPVYWIFVGWWWEPIAWIFLTLPKLIIMLFGKNKKTVTKECTVVVCQNCGYKWTI